MFITDIELGHPYVYQGKVVRVRQIRSLISGITIPDEHTVIVYDPLTLAEVTCKPHELAPCMYATLNTDTSTLEGSRNVLCYLNKQCWADIGSFATGTSVICLRRNGLPNASYVPCVGTIVNVTPKGRVIVDLWVDKSERVNVSKKAILWEPASQTES